MTTTAGFAVPSSNEPKRRRIRLIHALWITVLVFTVARPDGVGAERALRTPNAAPHPAIARR